LCEAYEVEWSDIGEFIPTGRLECGLQGGGCGKPGRTSSCTMAGQLVLDAVLPTSLKIGE
jgi:hypothetical protein